MNTESQNVLVAAAVRHELQHVRSHWCWFLVLGIAFLIGGTASIASPLLASVAAIRVLSIILMAAGIVTLVGSFWIGKWGGFLVNVLVGMLYLAGGFIVSERPLLTLVAITVYLAVSFMVMGLFRILVALTIRYPQWGWTLLNGGITFLVGLAIFRHLRQDAVWVIGLLVGLELIFSGWAWVMLALEIKRIPATVAEAI